MQIAFIVNVREKRRKAHTNLTIKDHPRTPLHLIESQEHEKKREGNYFSVGWATFQRDSLSHERPVKNRRTCDRLTVKINQFSLFHIMTTIRRTECNLRWKIPIFCCHQSKEKCLIEMDLTLRTSKRYSGH